LAYRAPHMDRHSRAGGNPRHRAASARV